MSSESVWAMVSAIGTCIAAGLAFFALRQANQIFKQQGELSTRIHKEQQLLAQRQLFTTLFQQLNELASIDPQNVNWVDVVKNVNFLELLGVSWEGELVDSDILFRVFDQYILTQYTRIKACKNAPASLGKDGEQMLLESRSATRLFEHVRDQHLNKNQPKPLKN